MREIPCATIWGGVRNENIDVCSKGADASLDSSSATGGKGGDIYYLAVCGDDRLTRVALADDLCNCSVRFASLRNGRNICPRYITNTINSAMSTFSVGDAPAIHIPQIISSTSPAPLAASTIPAGTSDQAFA